MTEYTEYIEYMQYDSEQRRSKLESLFQTLVTNEQDRFNFLQEIYHLETDTNIREYIQGQLQAQNAIPIPDSEWPMHGCDGKVYTRQQILSVPNLFICDPVDRSSFLSKPDGHIKVTWLESLGEGTKMPAGSAISIWSVALGCILTITACPILIIKLIPYSPFSTRDDGAIVSYIVLVFLLLIVGSAGFMLTNFWPHKNEARFLEQNGKLYLGYFRSIAKEMEIRHSKGKEIKTLRYTLSYIFKDDRNEFIFNSRVIRGERDDLDAALTLPSGAPVAVLYSKEFGLRLL